MQDKKIIDIINKNIYSLNNQKIIVTGANSGIGFAISEIVLSKGASLVMGCRNIDKANVAKETLLKKYPNASIEILIYDQSSLESSRSFVKEIISKHNDFNSLILNAGIFRPKKNKFTVNHFPLTSGTNYFGLLAILDELQGYLDNVSSEKRIIIQGSLAVRLKRFKSLNKSLLNNKMNCFKQYCLSKYGCFNAFYYYYMNNRNPNVKYLYSEPGICASNIYRNYPSLFKKIANKALSIFCHSCLSGALSTSLLASTIHSNGDYLLPSGFLTIRGLPKEGNIKDKYINKNLVNDSLTLIK